MTFGPAFLIFAIDKSSKISAKLSATFSSVGCPSFTLSATEASHGDMGSLQKRDVLILISYSGETQELKNIIQFANRNKIAVWVSFYSEVKFRPSYLSICQKQDEIYSSQMEKLIKEVNILNNQSFLTPREISETYLSMVDGLWQRILFDPKMYSHVFCKDLIKKYFRNIYTDEKRFV